MKRRIGVALMLLMACTSLLRGQDDNNVWVGGNLGFGISQEGESGRLFSLSIQPELSYEAAAGLTLGVRLGYMHAESIESYFEKDSYIGEIKEATNSFVLYPFVRYTIAYGNVGGVFIEGGFGYSYGKQKTLQKTIHEFEVGLRPGITINLLQNLVLVGRFGFVGYQFKEVSVTKSDYYGIDFNMDQFQLGINIVL